MSDQQAARNVRDFSDMRPRDLRSSVFLLSLDLMDHLGHHLGLDFCDVPVVRKVVRRIIKDHEEIFGCDQDHAFTPFISQRTKEMVQALLGELEGVIDEGHLNYLCVWIKKVCQYSFSPAMRALSAYLSSFLAWRNLLRDGAGFDAFGLGSGCERVRLAFEELYVAEVDKFEALVPILRQNASKWDSSAAMRENMAIPANLVSDCVDFFDWIGFLVHRYHFSCFWVSCVESLDEDEHLRILSFTRDLKRKHRRGLEYAALPPPWQVETLCSLTRP